MPTTSVAAAGDPYGCSLCTQLVPAQELATCALVLQRGSSFPGTDSAAPKQSAISHKVSSASSLSYTAPAMLQNVKVLFPYQSFTSSAAQRQGTGSNAISGHLFLPSQPRTAAQLSLPQTIAKDGHRQFVSGQASLSLLFWHVS